MINFNVSYGELKDAFPATLQAKLLYETLLTYPLSSSQGLAFLACLLPKIGELECIATKLENITHSYTWSRRNGIENTDAKSYSSVSATIQERPAVSTDATIFPLLPLLQESFSLIQFLHQSSSSSTSAISASVPVPSFSLSTPIALPLNSPRSTNVFLSANLRHPLTPLPSCTKEKTTSWPVSSPSEIAGLMSPFRGDPEEHFHNENQPVS